MLPPRVRELLRLEHPQVLAKPVAGVPWENHIVNEAALRRRERVRELFDVLLFASGEILTAEDDFDRTLAFSQRKGTTAGTYRSRSTLGPITAISAVGHA
jgi:hypothetical protein